MSKDIGPILGKWDYSPGQLKVRKISGADGQTKIQIRMDLGLMQLEWSGRPDAARPHGRSSLLEYYQEKRQQWEQQHGGGSFVLSRQDCWELAQEAMKYYWRRISFFELKEYGRAEEDALHNLAILDMCHACAECEEDRQMAEQYRPFVTAHRVQARALSLLEAEDYEGTLGEIRQGIGQIEEYLKEIGRFELLDSCPELAFLRDWESEVENARPLSMRERLKAELRAAVEQDKFELAASLRDRLRLLETETPARRKDI
jgi:hypothetical protein